MQINNVNPVLTGSPVERYFELQKQYKESLLRHYGSTQEQNKFLIQHAVDGAIKLLDAISLQGLLFSSNATRVLEVGSYLGFSTRWILDSTSATADACVTSLDPRVRHRVFDNLKQHVVDFSAMHRDRLTLIDAYLSEANVEMFLHDYLNYEPKWSHHDAVAHLKAIPTVTEPFDDFDFAFIDGDHSYQATLENVRLVSAMMPKGGLIIVHDAISWPEVKPALEALGKLPNLTFEGIAGSNFCEWFGNHHLLNGQPPVPPAYCLCDGLGLLRVAPVQLK
jgi:predicted O-methyltransferase YrrM